MRLRVAGLLPEAANRPPLQQDLLIMDLPATQRLFQCLGQLERMDLGWRTGRDGARLQAQTAAAPARGIAREFWPHCQALEELPDREALRPALDAIHTRLQTAYAMLEESAFPEVG